ncbi:MAG: DUF1501 domain-containing protein [Pirellulales bacterium]
MKRHDLIQPASEAGCASYQRVSRRALLQAGGLSGLLWLTPLARALGQLQDQRPQVRPKSLIVLWMDGGPSQLETFDPHPGTSIGGQVRAIETSVPGVRLASGLEQLADQMKRLAVVRNVVSKEGDHERAIYYVKTGYRPDPTVVHPALGAILCHELPDAGTEIPRHVAILPGQWPPRGGYMGDQYNAFLMGDPSAPPEDVRSPLSDTARYDRRWNDLSVVETEFARGRLKGLDQQRLLHQSTMQRARQMMTSDQLRAFDLNEVPLAEQAQFGDSRFGRACLVAARLIQVGVRCVEVSLGTWDSHVNNHETQAARVRDLDPGFAGLLNYLAEHELLDDTVVLWGGEFGRTPRLNGAEGRDHWPHGFSLALAGGGIRGGQVIGETDPEGSQIKYEDGFPVADVHATILKTLGVDYQRELITPVGRPLKLSDGQPIAKLIG